MANITFFSSISEEASKRKLIVGGIETTLKHYLGLGLLQDNENPMTLEEAAMALSLSVGDKAEIGVFDVERIA